MNRVVKKPGKSDFGGRHFRSWKSTATSAVAVMLAFVALGALPGQQGSPDTLSRAEVYSFLVLNCAYFGTWPEQDNPRTTRVLRIGVLGGDPLGTSLDKVSAKARATWFKDGKIVIERNIRSEELTDCNIVFVSSGAAESLAEILAAFRGRSVILVSDIPGFATHGGTIEARIEEERLAFDLNLDVLAASGVDLSSRMKSRANAIIRGGRKTVNPNREGGAG